jgi:hypothetical protein
MNKDWIFGTHFLEYAKIEITLVFPAEAAYVFIGQSASSKLASGE